jgi:hypothetical protein
MTERRATFFICDELLVSLNAKFNALGIYTGDIVIPTDPTVLSQLVICADVETPIEERFQSLVMHVLIPGETEPRTHDAASLVISNSRPIKIAERTIARIRIPFLIPQPTLTPGAIEVKFVHESGEIFAGKQFVLTSAQVAQAFAGMSAES